MYICMCTYAEPVAHAGAYNVDVASFNIYIYMYTYIYIYICIHIYIYTRMYAYASVYVCVYVRTYVCIHACMCMCIYAYIYRERVREVHMSSVTIHTGCHFGHVLAQWWYTDTMLHFAAFVFLFSSCCRTCRCVLCLKIVATLEMYIYIYTYIICV